MRSALGRLPMGSGLIEGKTRRVGAPCRSARAGRGEGTSRSSASRCGDGRSHGAAQRTPPACGGGAAGCRGTETAARRSDAAERRADQVEADRRQVEAARDAAIALADQTVPLLKDAMDRAHEQARGSGVYEGRLGAGFSQAHGAERALARNPAVFISPLR